MNINRLLNIIKPNRKYQKTYSQMGEDLIIKSYFNSIQVFTPSYIDLGAFDPFNLSNTALFYESGSNGINIEPNPLKYSKFLKYRHNDINLNIGIGTKNGEMNYYMMSSPVLNTFSIEQAKECEAKWGYKILDVIPVQVRPLSWVIQNYCPNKFPDFLSIDIEGEEEEIVNEIKTFGSLPSVICIETLTFAIGSGGVKRRDLIDSIVSFGFEIYADTHLNTILVRNNSNNFRK